MFSVFFPAVRPDRMRGGRNKFGPMYKRDRALKQQALRQRQQMFAQMQCHMGLPMNPGGGGIHPGFHSIDGGYPPGEPPDIKPDIAILALPPQGPQGPSASSPPGHHLGQIGGATMGGAGMMGPPPGMRPPMLPLNSPSSSQNNQITSAHQQSISSSSQVSPYGVHASLPPPPPPHSYSSMMTSPPSSMMHNHNQLPAMLGPMPPASAAHPHHPPPPQVASNNGSHHGGNNGAMDLPQDLRGAGGSEMRDLPAASAVNSRDMLSSSVSRDHLSRDMQDMARELRGLHEPQDMSSRDMSPHPGSMHRNTDMSSPLTPLMANNSHAPQPATPGPSIGGNGGVIPHTRLPQVIIDLQKNEPNQLEIQRKLASIVDLMLQQQQNAGSSPQPGNSMMGQHNNSTTQGIGTSLDGGPSSNSGDLSRNNLQLICKLCDQALFLLVEWARGAAYFRELKVG